MFTKLVCVNCNYVMYIPATESLLAKLQEAVETECPECNEPGDHNWLLGGTSSSFEF